MNASEQNRILAPNSAKHAAANSILLHQFDTSASTIKLINNIQVFSSQTHISFSRNFSVSRSKYEAQLLEELDETFLATKKQQWLKVQDELKRFLSLDTDPLMKCSNFEKINHVAGMDISFHKDNPAIACAGIVIYEIDHNRKRLKQVI